MLGSGGLWFEKQLPVAGVALSGVCTRCCDGDSCCLAQALNSSRGLADYALALTGRLT